MVLLRPPAIGAIIGLILVVISAFKPQYSPILAPDMPYRGFIYWWHFCHL
jgi:uncharacterized YccA/Bax inhibitor family protein